MENVDYSPAKKVRTTKVFFIIFGVLCLLAVLPLIAEGFEIWAPVAFFGIMFLLSGGVLEGFAQIVETACEQSWDIEQRYAQKPEELMDDSEVQ